MIKIEDFTEGMFNSIREAAKRSLMMIGVTADIDIKIDSIRKKYLRLTTGTFNTTPVIYKSIYIGGVAYLSEVEGLAGIYDLNFHLDYWFESFSGGSNGTSLGDLNFRVSEKSETINFLGFVIE